MFVIKTRLSRALLVFTLVMVAYGLATAAALYSAHTNIPPSLVRQERTMAVIYSSILIFLTSMQGGVAVLKSDRDYLFTLPLRRTEISVSLYMGQLMLSGVWTMVWLGWYVPFIRIPLSYGVPYIVLYVLLLTSLNASVAELEAKTRAIVASLMAVWNLLAVAGLPFSPGATLYGKYLTGTLTTAALSLGLTYYVLGLRLTKAPLLYSFPSPSRPQAAAETNTISFSGVKGLRAVLRMRLSTIAVTGRIGGVGAGGSRYIYRRTTLRAYIAYLTVAAVALLVLSAILVLRPDLLHANPVQVDEALVIVPSFVVLVLVDSSAMSQVSFERPWLSFTSARPSDYLRVSALAQAILSLLTVIPFSAAYAAMAAMGVRGALSVLPQLLIAGPCFSVIYFAFAAVAVATPQIRAEGFMPGQARAIGLLFTLLVIVQFAIFMASIGSATISLITSLVTLAVAASLLATTTPWSKAAERLVLAGYV